MRSLRPHHHSLLAALAAGSLLLSAGSTRADQIAAHEETIRLEPLLVAGLPAEDSINPLTREISSVFGDGRNILDTPRALASLTTALFNERQIHGIREILLYSASAYAGASYGKTTVPNLRGDTAETYLNGQRLSYNLYGYFPSFNGVEAIDLVRGPASAVFGAGYFTGGYINFVTKSPFTDTPRTTITTRIGTWSPGETSYLNGSLQIDSSTPLSSTLAVRVSYEGHGGDTFWKRNEVRDDRQDLFLALSWRPSASTRLDLNAQYLWQSSPEILGVNRVNQQLIDSGTYYTGDSPDLYPTPGPIPATAAVKLPWDATLFSKGDSSNANIWRLQSTLSHEAGTGFRFINRSLAEHVQRLRRHQFEYAEYVTQDTAENRSEAHVEFAVHGLPQKTIAGLALRYEGRESYTNYFNEYFYNFDITKPSRVFSQQRQFPGSYWPGEPGPHGLLFFSSVYDSPETVRSETWNPAAFLQQDLMLTRRLSATIGLRQETFLARARDPLPPAEGPFFRDSQQVSTHSQAYSLLYHPSSNTSLYITQNRLHSANGNVTGGGVILNVPDGLINRDDFRNLSKLLELGVKASLLDNRLFLAADWFEQWRSRVSIRGKKNSIVVRGVELDATYQTPQGLSLTANATFQNGHYLQSAPFQMGGRSIYDSYVLGRGPGGLGTATLDEEGASSFDPWGNQAPVGDWPLLGFSKILLNGSLHYRWKNGFGAGFNASWQSSQRGNLDNQWHIPPQTLLNANLSYTSGPWTYNLDLLNLGNKRNWLHNGDAYTGSQLLFPELPFRLEGYVKYRY